MDYVSGSGRRLMGTTSWVHTLEAWAEKIGRRHDPGLTSGVLNRSLFQGGRQTGWPNFPVGANEGAPQPVASAVSGTIGPDA